MPPRFGAERHISPATQRRPAPVRTECNVIVTPTSADQTKPGRARALDPEWNEAIMSVFTCHQADAVLDDAALQTVAGGFDWPLDINPAYFGPGPPIRWTVFRCRSRR